MTADKIVCFLLLSYIISGGAAFVLSQNTIKCWQCNRARSLYGCSKLVTCDATIEECFMDELLDFQQSLVYVGGCRAKTVCQSSGGKRSDTVTCSRCCATGDECNKRLCGIKDDTFNNTCYSCHHLNLSRSEVKDPRFCETVETCQSDEVCYSQSSYIGDGRVEFFSGCNGKKTCQILMKTLAYEDYKHCVSNKTALPPGPQRDLDCGSYRQYVPEYLCYSCCADRACNYGSCNEQNNRNFALAEVGKFDMNTLKVI